MTVGDFFEYDVEEKGKGLKYIAEFQLYKSNVLQKSERRFVVFQKVNN